VLLPRADHWQLHVSLHTTATPSEIGPHAHLNVMGFESGDEFAAAVEQGTAVGAKILLGDRPMDETLRRWAQAIKGSLVKHMLLELEEAQRGPARRVQQGAAGNFKLNEESITAILVKCLAYAGVLRRHCGYVSICCMACTQLLLDERRCHYTASRGRPLPCEASAKRLRCATGGIAITGRLYVSFATKKVRVSRDRRYCYQRYCMIGGIAMGGIARSHCRLKTLSLKCTLLLLHVECCLRRS
jgi:hypothetical protein